MFDHELPTLEAIGRLANAGPMGRLVAQPRHRRLERNHNEAWVGAEADERTAACNDPPPLW